MALPPRIQLLTASMDLYLVRLIRGAMNANQPGSAGGSGGAGPVIGPRFQVDVEPEPRFAPRRVIDPEPRFPPRLTIHPEPHVAVPEPPAECAPATGEVLTTFGPLATPWQMRLQERPWNSPVDSPTNSPVEVKVLARTVEINDTGRLLDQFA